MKGFFKKILVVDLNNLTFETEEISEEILANYLGGKGLATHLLLERNPAGVDPLSPDNLVILALGPVTDSPIYGSCRHGIYSKSPLTGFYGESYSGGSLAIQMSCTGFDAFILKGASEKAVWLEITDGGVKFHDASDLWGLDTYQTEKEVKTRAGAEKSGSMVIGPAGENLVKYAVIENDRWRSAGRTGMGAVLGSKKVKALVFHGDKSREFADLQGARDYARETVKNLKDHPATKAYRDLGTPMMVKILNRAKGFPTRYWAAGTYEKWEEISANALLDKCKVTPRACKTCFMACGKYTEILEGRHTGLKIEGPEYETIYAFGGLCLIDRIDEIAYLNDLCDRLGIDTITAGNMVAFAIEAAKRGKISEKIEYGDVDSIAEFIQKIAKREGTGELFAEGIKKTSEELGLEEIAVHVKGLEPAGYDPRALKGMALAYAVSDRGACHLRTTFYKAELAGMFDPSDTEELMKVFIDFEDRCTLFDSLILCRFYRDFYLWDELSKIIELTTGEKYGKDGLSGVAARIVNNTRRFNLREGLTAKDDRLPKRLVKEALEEGQKIEEKDVEELVKGYYRLRGWSEEGVPEN